MADITVLIVDDQPLMLHALKTFIENEDGVSVVGTAEDGQVMGAISAAAFSFIVHDPSWIIECTREMSRFSSRFR